MDSSKISTSTLWLTVVRYKTNKGIQFFEIGDKLFKSEKEALLYADEFCTNVIYKIPKINKKSVEIGAKELALAQLENN